MSIQSKLVHYEIEWKNKYLDVLAKFPEVFDDTLGDCNVGFHSINTTDDIPVYRKQFPLPQAHREEIIQTVKEWLSLGVIERSSSEYSAPIFLVPKKIDLADEEGNQKVGKRLVTDFRELNKKTVKSNYRLPLINELIEEVGNKNGKIFSQMDLSKAFFQLRISPRDKHKTAFHVPTLGTFHYRRAPFGLQNLPTSYQRLMDRILDSLVPHVVQGYLDDLLCATSSHTQMLEDISKVLQRLSSANLKLSPKKCKFGVKQVNFLGYNLSAEGYKPMKSKVNGILACKPPDSIKAIRSFIGCVQYFRSSIPNFATLSANLTNLTRKNSGWTSGTLPEKALNAFNKLKQILASEPVLAYPIKNGPYHLYVDASQGEVGKNNGGLACVLVQIQNGIPKAIGYASRALKSFEANYNSYLLEMQSCVFAITHFETLLTGIHFTLHSDNLPLTKLHKKVHTRTFNRLQELMLSHSFTHSFVRGENNPSDFQSRHIASIVTKEKVEDSKLPFLSNEDFAELQAEDPLCSALLSYVRAKKIPTGKLKTLVRRLGPSCKIIKKVLCILISGYNGEQRWLKFAPAAMHTDIIMSAHATTFCGHSKVFKTTQRILQEFFWVGLHSDCLEYVNSCINCQKSKRRDKLNHAPLHPLPQPEAPLTTCHLDLFGPLKAGGTAKKYILVCVDSFTKYAEFIAIDNKLAETVANAFFNRWICRFGSCAVAITDCGGEFVSNFNKELFNLLQIDKRQTTSFHAATNATVELRNKFIASYLKTALNNENVKDWEKYLPSLQFAYNSGVSKAHKSSPFFLLHGIHPRSPHFDPNWSDKVKYGENYAQDILKRLQYARKVAMEHNISYKQAYKETHDQKSKNWNFTEGMLVLLHRPELCRINPKISQPWCGPYLITSLPNETNAVIQDLKSQKTRYVHLDRLKLYKGNFDTDVKSSKRVTRANSSRSPPQDSDAQCAQQQQQKTCPTIPPPPSTRFSTPDAVAAKSNGHSFPQPQFIEIESDDIIVVNPEDTPPKPIPIKDEPVEPAETVSPTLDMSSDEEISFKTPVSSPSPIKTAAARVKEGFNDLVSNFHLPSNEEVGNELRLTRLQAKAQNVTLKDPSLPDLPLEYQKQ